MPVVEDDVPQWKKELIKKKQMWKRSGGWSVPPVMSKTGLQLRPPDFGKFLDRTVTLHQVDSNNNDNNGTINNFTGSIENVNCFGSVSELKSIFQPSDDEVFTPLTKARSEENILDGPVVLDAHRRSSTSSQFSRYEYPDSPKKNVKTVPKMEDFFKKYRKTTRKSVVVEMKVESPEIAITGNQRRRRSDTIYFVDINQSELPPRNTVRQTVKAFEEPVKNEQKSEFEGMTSSSDVTQEALPRAKDVVQKFEAKIKSSSRESQAPPKPPRTSRPTGAGASQINGASRPNGAGKPQMLPKPAIVESASEPKKKPKHVSFHSDDGRILNLGLQDGAATDLSSIRDDLKTVTINTNQSIIIKTV